MRHPRWEDHIASFVHPIKVALLEALMWVDEPISARAFDKMFDERFGVSLVSYHMRKLVDLGILEKSHQKTRRGAVENFYRISRKTKTRC